MDKNEITNGTVVNQEKTKVKRKKKVRPEILYIRHEFRDDWKDFCLATDSLDDRLKIVKAMKDEFFEYDERSRSYITKPTSGKRETNGKMALLIFIRSVAKQYRDLIKADAEAIKRQYQDVKQTSEPATEPEHTES